jgi:hypothetical protein
LQPYTERQHWETVLLKIGKENMIQTGVAGHWSIKDVVVHIAAYESWLAEWLTAAQRGKFLSLSVLDDADINRRNERVYIASQSYSLEEVPINAPQTFQDLVTVIETFPESDFTDYERTAWFMKPYWSRITTLGAAITNLSYQHYQEHVPELTSWLEKCKPVSSHPQNCSDQNPGT